ncbi:MAG: hypothetical protein ACREFQ_00395, partial [Stellaceae bacterium]
MILAEIMLDDGAKAFRLSVPIPVQEALSLAMRASRIARQMRSRVAGMSMWRMPNSASASTSALMTEGRPPAQPASPQP